MIVICTCSFRNGFTIAQYRSAESAVNVNTDTPIDMSFAHSVMRHNAEPHGHDSNVYNSDANGTHIMITSKSANANENIYLKNIFLKKQQNEWQKKKFF